MKKYTLPLIVILLFSGCRKKDSETLSVYLIPQEVKDYTFFLPGTYWIYQDSITGIEDSVYVTDAGSGKDTIEIDQDDPGNEVVEYFQYYTKSTTDILNSESYDCNTSFYKCDKINGNWPCFLVNRTNLNGSGFCFFYEFINGYWAYSGWHTSHSKITFVNRWNSLELNNVFYNDVVEFYDNKNITENDNNTRIFFSKNIGIIRKELVDSNQTWNLLRSKIVQ